MKKSLIMIPIIILLVLCICCTAGYFLFKKSEDNTAKNRVTSFLQTMKSGNYDEFAKDYSLMIDVSPSTKETPDARIKDLYDRRKQVYDKVASEYKFSDIQEFKIEKTDTKVFQYELSTDAKVNGTIIYKDGKKKAFVVYQRGTQISSVEIDGKCLFKSVCS